MNEGKCQGRGFAFEIGPANVSYVRKILKGCHGSPSKRLKVEF